MSLLNVNSLITTISTYPVDSATGSVVDSSHKPIFGQSENTDKFTRGQWWKNQAAGQGVKPESNTYSRSAIAPRVRGLVDSAGEPNGIGQEQKMPGEISGETQTGSVAKNEGEPSAAGGPTKPTGEPLSQSEIALLDSLKKADIAVRAHEMAHLAAAGGLAKGGASFKMQRGPDGKSYAVGGEVQIDVSKGATPEMTVEKMRNVRRAALAPADPSPQDQKVAAQATITIAEALQEINLGQALEGNPGAGQVDNPSEEQNSLSARDVYQDYGQSFVQKSSGEVGSTPPRGKQLGLYGQIARSSSVGSVNSSLAITV